MGWWLRCGQTARWGGAVEIELQHLSAGCCWGWGVCGCLSTSGRWLWWSVLTGRVLVTAGHNQHPSLCSLSHSGIPAGFAAAGCAWGVLLNQSHHWILEQKSLSSKNSSSRDRSNIQPRINNQGEVLPWGCTSPSSSGAVWCSVLLQSVCNVGGP